MTVRTDFGGAEDIPFGLVLRPDGSIVMAGSSGNTYALASYDPNGYLNGGFGSGGKVTTTVGTGTSMAWDLALQSDGKVLAAGSASTASGGRDFSLVRYNTSGTLDTTFGSGGIVTTDFGGSTDVGQAVVVQGDGRIVVAGYGLVAGDQAATLVRYNTNGTLDTTFDGDGKVVTNLGPGADQAYAIALQADGKILAAGIRDNGTDDDIAVMRYTTSGALDTTFSGDGIYTFDSGGMDAANGVVVQTDQKIVIAGSMEAGGHLQFGLMRFNTNGTLDATFGSGGIVTTSFGGANDAVGYAVALQSDGRILVAGIVFDGTQDNFAVARYTTTGALDTTFSADGIVSTPVGSADDEAFGMAVQADGRIVVGGASDGAGGAADFAMVRYNTDGSLDTSFDGVNSEPSFTRGLHEVILTGLARTAAGWATGVSAGPPDESAQVLNFIVTNDNAALFSVAPAVAADGTLTYTIAPGAVGVANVNVSLHDNGGTANGGDDTSPIQTFHITAFAANPLNGGAEADNVIGGAGADTLNGGGDNDVLIGAAGADALNGGAGTDFAQYDTVVVASLISPAQNTGVALGDTYTSVEGLIGSSFDDTLIGDNNANELRGGAGNDYLQARNGNDTLIGGAGTDNLEGGPGADALDGGAGTDYAKYTFAAAGVTVDLQVPANNLGEAAGDTFVNVEGIIGTGFNDVLWGDAGINDIAAVAGDDQLYGRGGNDNLQGGDGNDTLTGGAGADRLNGGNGIDIARYDVAVTVNFATPSQNTADAVGDTYVSIEVLLGSDFTDILIGDDLVNDIRGGDGGDTIQGRGGNDTIDGGNGNDFIEGGLGADAMNGGAGMDYARYQFASAAVRADLAGTLSNTGDATGDTYLSIEGLVGSAFNDLLYGDAAVNDLAGVDGNDVINGRAGDDNLQGGNGADQLDGGAGVDRYNGGAGADEFIVRRGEGNGDTILDFSAAAGDHFTFVGYGAGSTFTPNGDGTHWTITSSLGGTEVLTLSNGAAVGPGDYVFI